MNQVTKSNVVLCFLVFMVAACGGNSSSTPPVVSPPPTSDGGSGDNSGPVRLADIEFGKGATASGQINLLLDIYQPSESCATNRPTVLFVHGGSFKTGDKYTTLFESLAEATNKKDINFVSINYRLAGDDAVLKPKFQVIADETVAAFPNADPVIINAAVAAIEDTVSALNWMQTNAQQYCLDMNRLAYWGSSAGSYTVLNVAYTLDQYNIDRPSPDVVINYWGDLVREADLEFMDAPFLTLHGDADTVVVYQAALDLAAQADIVSVPYSFYTVQEAGHAWSSINIFTLQINGVSILDKTLNFIEAHIVGGTPVYETVSVPG